VLETTDWFEQDAEQGDIAARCHAFEACLFMIGYDLRCFNVVNTGTPLAEPDMKENMELSEQNRNWVPTGHPFVAVITMYVEFRKQAGDSGANAASFQQYLMEKHSYAEVTARSYCFPFSENEFDLFDIPLDRLATVLAGGEEGLYAALNSTDPYCFSEERELVCLMDVFITGAVSKLSPAQRVEKMMALGYAGTENASNTLLNVGRSVGTHFGLLDQQNQPTEFFHRFFGTDPATLHHPGMPRM
jgi:hypothetical protein